jgi:chemotaxis regulatin CheY-phosphate phosphatase CheZ
LELDTKTQIEQLKIHDFELEQRRESEVKERIRQIKIEAARDAASEAISPIKEGLDQITAKIFEAAQEMAQKLQTADFVPGALAKRARQMCEWYRLMNFTRDTSLEEVLERLQSAAGAEAKHRSRTEMQSALNDVLRATSLQSKRLLDEDRLSALEI